MHFCGLLKSVRVVEGSLNLVASCLRVCKHRKSNHPSLASITPLTIHISVNNAPQPKAGRSWVEYLKEMFEELWQEALLRVYQLYAWITPGKADDSVAATAISAEHGGDKAEALKNKYM